MPRWLFFGAGTGTNTALSTMNFAYHALPFVYVPAKTSINLSTMDFAYLGLPFVPYARG